MPVFKCKMCGGDLQLNENVSVGECGYCGTRQTLPRLDDDKRANLYDRANHFRRNGEFDKAAAIYETILNEDKTDAEAYWSIVLCKYGIEYVEDPRSHKRIPTCNRTQFTSIFADEDYRQAIANADASAKVMYEAEAKVIDKIQKGILDISAKEEPFDVFICYKESDQNGRRTPDSVLAQDLYFQLKQDGFKVFFSRITLEDKLGTAYEPYIFAALNSSKVMVVIGTKPENFNSPWVKNEWSRYLALVKNGASKILIPAYKDMDPYDLPEEFSHLQAQDMSKLGFMQDLIRGIMKIVKDAEPNATKIKETTVMQTSTNTEKLLERAFLCLEDCDWDKADHLIEQVLNLEPKNARAYIGKLMIELQARNESEIIISIEPLTNYNNFLRALEFADEKTRVVLEDYKMKVIATINNRKKEIVYQDAKSRMKYFHNNLKISNRSVFYYQEYYETIAKDFKAISGYKDSNLLHDECLKLAFEEKTSALQQQDTFKIKLSDAKNKIETAKNDYEIFVKTSKKRIRTGLLMLLVMFISPLVVAILLANEIEGIFFALPIFLIIIVVIIGFMLYAKPVMVKSEKERELKNIEKQQEKLMEQARFYEL